MAMVPFLKVFAAMDHVFTGSNLAKTLHQRTVYFRIFNHNDGIGALGAAFRPCEPGSIGRL
jgi:hypothetical protein